MLGHNPKRNLGQRKSLGPAQECHKWAVKHSCASLGVGEASEQACANLLMLHSDPGMAQPREASTGVWAEWREGRLGWGEGRGRPAKGGEWTGFQQVGCILAWLALHELLRIAPAILLGQIQVAMYG